MDVRKIALRLGLAIVLVGLLLATVSAQGTMSRSGSGGTLLENSVFLPIIATRSQTTVFGVSTYWPLDESHGLKEMQAMNAQWVRLAFSWAAVEPVDTTPDDYSWGSLDTLVRGAQSADLLLTVTVHNNEL